ncbi:DUF4136 domain-containing protein [Sungkyunkwania multivorans]|uniref:DUF4136 domain-containing protein n=1 Tax=Sungkyunkwania multivorans TaxID=1173618 RepID=A0ABW3D128_9FLAO
MKIVKLKILMNAILALLLLGCASSNVIADEDPEIDFKDYTTFTICQEDLLIHNPNYPQYDNEQNREKIKEAITDQMLNKGYVLEEGSPELQAGFELVILDREMVVTNCYDEREPNYWPECKLTAINYTEQTLVLYVMDLQKNRIIWQGSMAGALIGSPKKMTRAIDETVARIFKEYPI